MKVALVIGHSETNQGARNSTHNISEFEFNRTLARLIRQHWGPGDLELVYRDCPYKELPGKINALNPKVILSLHCNAFNGKVSGTETLYYHKSRLGKECAKSIQEYLVSALELPNRGIKARKEVDRGGFLLKHTKAPCVISEPFFIDNDLDFKTAWAGLDELVEAYTIGIRKMLWVR